MEAARRAKVTGVVSTPNGAPAAQHAAEVRPSQALVDLRAAERQRTFQKLTLWVFLIVLGVFAACASLASDVASSRLEVARRALDARFPGSSLLNRVAWSVPLALLAHALTVRCPEATGSGIPELRVILSSAPSQGMLRYLSPATLASKLVGLVFVTGAGLSVGREGPLVHISCCVAHILAPRSIRASPRHMSAALRAGAAAGVAFTFGAPVGGLLFAAEVSVTFFRVSHMPRALACALSGLLAVSWLNYGSLAPFKAKVVAPARLVGVWEAGATAGLGLLCGILALAFNVALAALLNAKERWMNTRLRALGAVLAVSVATALVTSGRSPLQLLALPPSELLPRLLQPAGFHDGLVQLPEWARASESAAGWLAACLGKLCLTAVTIVLPIPCGLFIPTFAAGGFAGRAWARLLQHFASGTPLARAPSGYALVGAAALSASVTGTVSTSVIAIELTGVGAGELSPIALACVVAIVVRSVWVPSVYDVIAKHRRLPGHTLLHMRMSDLGPLQRSQGLCTLTAADVVATIEGQPLPVLTDRVSAAEIRRAAEVCAGAGNPVVAVVAPETEVLDAPPEPDAGAVPMMYRLVGTATTRHLLAIVERTEDIPQSSRRSRSSIVSSGRPDTGPLSLPLLQEVQETAEAAMSAAGVTAQPPTVDLRRAVVDSGPVLDLNPFIVHADLALKHVVHIFQMLDLSQVFVVDGGAYVGTVSREGLSLQLAQVDWCSTAAQLGRELSVEREASDGSVALAHPGV